MLVVDQRTDAALAVGRGAGKRREKEREREGESRTREREGDVMANGRNYTLHFKREYPENGRSYRYETKSVFKRGIFAGSPRPGITHTAKTDEIRFRLSFKVSLHISMCSDRGLDQSRSYFRFVFWTEGFRETGRFNLTLMTFP